MENLLNSPGLQHLAENIFLNLNYEKLKICQMINQTSYQILNGNPILWIMFFRRKLSEENQKYLIRTFASMNFYSSTNHNHIVSYLRWNLENKNLLLLPQDLLCYTSPVVQSDLRQKIYQAAQNGSTKIVEILAPLTDNPNAPDENGRAPIYWAAKSGHTEIVKIMAPLTDNPNSTDKNGQSPIFWAAHNGHTEIVKILAPLTDNPNAPDKYGKTPIYWAAYHGHSEIVKILTP